MLNRKAAWGADADWEIAEADYWSTGIRSTIYVRRRRLRHYLDFRIVGIPHCGQSCSKADTFIVVILSIFHFRSEFINPLSVLFSPCP